MIDWIRLLEDNHIYFVTAGPNTGRGEISINCPFCAGNDPSFHLGINLSTGKWNCWRDSSHRGKFPDRLIGALLRLSGTAVKYTIESYSNSNIDEFDSAAANLCDALHPKARQGKPNHRFEPVTLPAEFDPIKTNNLTRKFWCHIANRGIDNVERVINEYSLKCCLIGRWKGRLIIPVFGARSSKVERLTFNQKGVGSSPTVPALIGWQGRSLRTVETAPRYLTSSPSVKRTVYNMQYISEGGDTLYICEGPMDAIKIDYYLKPRIRATCVFGATPTEEQIGLLYRIAGKFKRVVVMFDNDLAGTTEGFKLSDWLPGVEFGILPEGHKDTDLISPELMRRYKW